MDTSVLNSIIIGRVEPHIYAFSTQTVPNYLKIGDTYRPLEQRLNEWRKYFPNLKKQFTDVAKVSEDTYFRDFAIHYFLEVDRELERLLPNSIPGLPYYSKEFFKNASVDDIEDALIDIRKAFEVHSNKYQFYSFAESRIPLNYTYPRVDSFEPRPNQEDTIENFNKARESGRNNLLMYAVMRFGKSFTSMCCAVEMKAKLVVVVSAKADVKQEWKHTVESHIKFIDYIFMDSNSLLANENALSKSLKTNSVVLFLTLQDLMGDDIKAKHKQVFENEFDLLIIDESHYGARASEYGKVLSVTKTELKKELSGADPADDYENNETLKLLRPKIRLHLSGTPYRILMGDEFTKEDIIAFYQFTDIVKEQENWDKSHILNDEMKEWDNPYYGFPQMIRFAFNPNESSIKKMEELKRSGITYAFSELFRPQSILKDTSPEKRHTKFVHEKEILDLLEVIDGSKRDENLLGFLDYDKIKNGKMCRHIVCVLPYCASCDALEKLITDNKDKFKNLKDYEIVNISGVYNSCTKDWTEKIKNKIKEIEDKGKKSFSITCNRMLTGTTVEQWDTMLYLKDTASPQEYDQAIFRLQNQYIRKYKDKNGDVIKYNMKPQTLLVDFDPDRMFRLQEQKSQIYNVNIEENGNSKLEERIKDELRISPIITLNKDKLQEVVPENILDAVRKYSTEKSVIDEASDIPADLSLMNDNTIREEIEKLSPISSSKGIDIKAVTGDGDDFKIPEDSSGDDDRTPKYETKQSGSDSNENDDYILGKKLATYYAQILFFAFLTDSNVKSLEDIIKVIDNSDENKRISQNVGLKLSVLLIIQKKSNPFILSKLDYKIQNLNTLMKDTALMPDKRVEVAMTKFGRLSSNEIVTPMAIAKEMVDVLPVEEINENTKILDIASKQGEFTRALYNKFGDKIKNHIYAIPTSPTTYEFTRKVYSLLDMPTENVFSEFNTYDIIDITKNETIMKKLQDMKFDVILGNPPYQESDGGGLQTNSSSGSSVPLYQSFVQNSKRLNPQNLCMIIQDRWFSGGRGLDKFRQEMLDDKCISVLADYSDRKICFPDTDFSGGVCYFLRRKDYSGTCTVINYDSNKIYKSNRNLNDFSVFIRHKLAIDIVNKVISKKQKMMSTIVYSSNIFGFRSYIKGNPRNAKGSIALLGNTGITYVNRNDVSERSKDLIGKWKVIMSKTSAEHAGETDKEGKKRIVSRVLVLPPEQICSETYLLLSTFDTEKEAINMTKYIKTQFCRFLLSTVILTQNIAKDKFQFIPEQNYTEHSDIDWDKSIIKINQQLYTIYNFSDEEINFINSTIKEME